MAKNPARQSRVADQIQRELADLIRLEMKDPRVGLITITGVDVTRDYAHAKVHFTAMQGEAQAEEVTRALQHAAGFLRSELSHRLALRSVPQLHFAYDVSVERGMHLSRLIDEANRDSPSGESET
ncbi:MAG: 30S ribosome-binding factor RbfA [Betaproteobacteria bacterium]|nr:30S ribosome-binding factor RbfA [Betaproteobacteria bacterium]